MLVYRDQKQELLVRPTLSALYEKSKCPCTHEEARALLTELGELEAGAVDALHPHVDTWDPLLAQIRQVSELCGRFFYHSWRGTPEAEVWQARFHRALGGLLTQALPPVVSVGVPEGYAYYSLYPEMYLQAAEDFALQVAPQRVVVVGLRNIGTSLSAVVAATLEEHGAEVHSYTVRPHGHPFDRRLFLAPRLEQEWRRNTEARFIIVDEGPGLSGTSLTSVAQKLAELGVPCERILFLPSWAPDGNAFVSPRVRNVWNRHRKYTASFERVWIDSGRLTQGCDGAWTDISGGNWRQLFFQRRLERLPVQPQNERRKFVCRDSASGKPIVLKFAGLGKYGQRILERAERLAQAGWGPRPIELRHGFLATELVEGQPLEAGLDDGGLREITRYLAWVARAFPAAQPQPFEALVEMIRVNAGEGLGTEWRDRTEWLESYEAVVKNAPATELDARMFPHEWLVTPMGWLKTDGLEHHDDHFFPGPQNGAWDVAGTSLEFGLGPEKQAYLVEHYAALTQDPEIRARLPFFRVAYLAYRLGYVIMAAQALGDSASGERFKAWAAHYAELLRQELIRNEEQHGRKTISSSGALSRL